MAYQIQGSVIINDDRELVNVGASTISVLSVTSATTTEDLVVNGTVSGTAGILTTGSLEGGDISIGGSITVNGDSYFDQNAIFDGEIHGPANLVIDPSPIGDVAGSVTIKGDLYVQGTEFIVDSTTVNIADKTIGLGTGTSTDALLDGAGFTIGDSGVLKSFTFVDASDTLQSSIGLGVASGNDFKVGSTSVLNETTLGSTVVNSSLTSVGTLADVTVAGDINANGNIVGDAATEISGIATITVSGGVVAANFYGDGSGLTNLPATGIDLTGTDQSFNTVAITTTTGVALDVTGSVAIGGSVTVDGVAYIDELVLTNALAFVGATEAVIGLATVTTDLTVGGNIIGDGATNISGIASVTSTEFYGDGSNLTGVVASGSIAVSNDGSYVGAGFTILNVAPSDGIEVAITGTPGAAATITYSLADALSFGALELTAAGVALTVTNDVSVGGDLAAANVSASSSVTAANFYGDGSNITGISADDSNGILVADNQDNTDYPMVFASAVGAGASIYSDSTTSFEFTYNPSTGTATAATFDSVSDERLKDNIETIEGATEKVASLRGVEFDWKGIDGSSVGVIAQDVQKVYPQLVTDHGDRLTVNYDGLVGLLVQAVKELTARVEELEG